MLSPSEIAGLTQAQRRLVLASGPDDRTGEEGHGVEIKGSDYRVASALQKLGLGTYSHGDPYGDLYFNTAEGLRVRHDMLGEPCKRCDDSGYVETIHGGFSTGEGVWSEQDICDCVCGYDVRRELGGT